MGTGACTVQEVGIWDCNNNDISINGEPNCPKPFTGIQSKIYKIMQFSPNILDNLPPGGQIDIPIKFTAPYGSHTGYPNENEFDAIFAAKIYDKYSQSTGIYSGLHHDHGWTPNLKGKTGEIELTVLPADIDFGPVSIGCYSKAYQVCVYNTGTAPINVTKIRLNGCTPEFHLKSIPSLPKQLSTGNPVCFKVTYSPDDEGVDECSVVIKSNYDTQAIANITLKGSGTTYSHQKDVFKQVSGNAVDILFVIDDSGSMGEEQAALKASFDKFIQHAQLLHNDYHLGVIDVCVENKQITGRLNLGDPKKQPRFITPKTPDGINLFKKYIMLGINSAGGCSDVRESGLEAAKAALSPPLISDTGMPCTSDSDCLNDSSICPDKNNCPYKCVDGTCAGWNKGFLRKDAQLEIIVLSDEEDQSHGSPDFFIKFFKSIKGAYNTDMFHWNSIVGVPIGGGDCSKGCKTAERGCRYVKVSQATNGKIGSVCAPDYSKILDEIGSQAFGIKRQFFLSRVPQPQSITVTVNDKDCGQGWLQPEKPQGNGWNWWYDEASNSIIFEEKGACMPRPGDQIVIEYDTPCLQQQTQ